MPADRLDPPAGSSRSEPAERHEQLGLPKRLLAETDMFAIDHTSELYAHMNANYVRIGELPDFDHYGRMLEAVSRGDYFISMGEVLLPEVEISKASPSAIKATARVQWTFPLAFGEIVWGDGKETFTQTFDLDRDSPIRQRDVRVEHGGEELAMGARSRYGTWPATERSSTRSAASGMRVLPRGSMPVPRNRSFGTSYLEVLPPLIHVFRSLTTVSEPFSRRSLRQTHRVKVAVEGRLNGGEVLRAESYLSRPALRGGEVTSTSRFVPLRECRIYLRRPSR